MTEFLPWLLGPSVSVAQERPYDGGGAVSVTVVLAIRWLTGQGERSRSDGAVDTLRERYARGGINQDEFEAKRRDLR